MVDLSLRSIARALGGEVSGAQVLAPGPLHSPRDRSLSIRLSASSPDGFICHSFAGNGWQACRDYVKSRLGLAQFDPPLREPKPAIVGDDAKRMSNALALWREGVDPRGTLAERYLNNRGLILGDDIAGGVLRWSLRLGAMVALFRNITTGEPQAVSRTFLDREGRKVERKFLGPVGGAAVMLDPFDAVTTGLHVGEGVETVMAAHQLDLRPAWALGSAGAIAGFPVLGGVECLTLLAEHDAASARAVEACGRRWHAAGREVLIVRPTVGSDLNDAIRGAA
jgi:hypothetical protein